MTIIDVTYYSVITMLLKKNNKVDGIFHSHVFHSHWYVLGKPKIKMVVFESLLALFLCFIFFISVYEDHQTVQKMFTSIIIRPKYEEANKQNI